MSLATPVRPDELRSELLGRVSIGHRSHPVPDICNHLVVAESPLIVIPAGLLHAVANRSGRIALVIGAGCSLEAPTSLRLGREYSLEIFEALVADGVISRQDCTTPDDLSMLASAVHRKMGSQSAVVQRFPRGQFRYARANAGYLAAAALLCEGSISCVATLNYDLALTDAVRQLDGADVEEISGPGGMQHFGNKAIVYLHRNVNEQDDEKWILRKEALDDEWRDSWESVVVARVAASPVTVFAGLGSPAAVLTETLSRIRKSVPDALEAYLVDPSEQSAFAAALELPSANHVRASWGEFMRHLSDRLAEKSRADLAAACKALCSANGWSDTSESIDAMCASLQRKGLVAMGLLRARWLCSSRAYEPDTEDRRPLVADLLMAVGLLAGSAYASLQFTVDGLIVIAPNDGPTRTVLPISGQGHRRWSQIDAILSGRGTHGIPDLVVAGAFQGPAASTLAPPSDIIDGEPNDDVAQGHPRPQVISVEELRADPDAFCGKVA